MVPLSGDHLEPSGRYRSTDLLLRSIRVILGGGMTHARSRATIAVSVFTPPKPTTGPAHPPELDPAPPAYPPWRGAPFLPTGPTTVGPVLLCAPTSSGKFRPRHIYVDFGPAKIVIHKCISIPK